MQNALVGKLILITQATEFMGPALCDIFEEQGARVVRSEVSLSEPESAQNVVSEAGAIDVLVANLSILAPSTSAEDVDQSEWRAVFAALEIGRAHV